jgi:hypothetical protein
MGAMKKRRVMGFTALAAAAALGARYHRDLRQAQARLRRLERRRERVLRTMTLAVHDEAQGP